MPKAYRKPNVEKYDNRGDRVLGEYQNVPWSELSTKEFITSASIRLGIMSVAAATVVASIPNGPVDFWGDYPDESTREHQVDRISKSAKEIVDSIDTEQSFALTYLSPIQLAVSGEEGGKGVLKALPFRVGENMTVSIGQNCLQGSAYDTGASYITGRRVSGELSAVASLSVTDDIIQVHPAGSDAPSLKFSMDEFNLLVADETTSNTLSAYGCEIGLGTYEKVGYETYERIDLGLNNNPS